MGLLLQMLMYVEFLHRKKNRVWVVPLCMCMTGIHGFGSEWEKHKFQHNQTSTFHLILLPCIFVPFLYRLNILAELLRFGDREFYKDWWNAKTVEEVKDLLIIHACFFKKILRELWIELTLWFSMHFIWDDLSGWPQYWRMWNMVIFFLFSSSNFSLKEKLIFLI